MASLMFDAMKDVGDDVSDVDFFLQIHFGSSGGFGGCCEES
jgi:hypothetical protein